MKSIEKCFKDRIKSTYWAKTPAGGRCTDASAPTGRLGDGCAVGGPSNTPTNIHILKSAYNLMMRASQHTRQ